MSSILGGRYTSQRSKIKRSSCCLTRPCFLLIPAGSSHINARRAAGGASLERSLTYSLVQVEGLIKIESFAGRLESESIILASGLDLFGSRVSPSRSFDVLSPTFNKAQLLITITVLSLGLAVTRNMVRFMCCCSRRSLTLSLSQVKARQIHQKWYFL